MSEVSHISFLYFIPKCLVFDTLVNIFFKFYFPNAVQAIFLWVFVLFCFYKLIVYTVTLLNSLISSTGFIDHLGFLCKWLYHLQIEIMWLSFFLIFMTFIYFSCLITLAKPPVQCCLKERTYLWCMGNAKNTPCSLSVNPPWALSNLPVAALLLATISSHSKMYQCSVHLPPFSEIILLLLITDGTRLLFFQILSTYLLVWVQDPYSNISTTFLIFC